MIEQMEVENTPVVVKTGNSPEELTARPQHLLNAYTTKDVCQTCNNGWMSMSEVWFKQAMGELVKPEPSPQVGKVLINALQENEKMAQWALKTAVTICCNCSNVKHHFNDENVLRHLAQGKLTSNILVDLAYINEIRDEKPISQIAHAVKGGFACVMLFQHLAIRVIKRKQEQIQYKPLLQVFPVCGNPSDVLFIFETVYSFMDHIRSDFT
jgi:hypothetical protein